MHQQLLQKYRINVLDTLRFMYEGPRPVVFDFYTALSENFSVLKSSISDYVSVPVVLTLGALDQLYSVSHNHMLCSI